MLMDFCLLTLQIFQSIFRFVCIDSDEKSNPYLCSSVGKEDLPIDFIQDSVFNFMSFLSLI